MASLPFATTLIVAYLITINLKICYSITPGTVKTGSSGSSSSSGGNCNYIKTKQYYSTADDGGIAIYEKSIMPTGTCMTSTNAYGPFGNNYGLFVPLS